MTGPIEIRVIGQPAPQGSKRAVARGVMIESSRAVKPWRAAVAAATAARMHTHHHPGWPTGPVTVTVTFFLPRPTSLPKRVAWPAKRPDLDKFIRATLDGLTESGIWHDDAQVVTIHARKRYAAPGQPLGAYIAVHPGPTINGTRP